MSFLDGMEMYRFENFILVPVLFLGIQHVFEACKKSVQSSAIMGDYCIGASTNGYSIRNRGRESHMPIFLVILGGRLTGREYLAIVA